MCLHETEIKSNPGMKKILYRGMKQVEFYPGMKFSLKESKHIIRFIHFFSIFKMEILLDTWYITWLQLIMLKIFIIYIVINIIANFLIKAISPMVLRKRVQQKLYYQRFNYTM